MTESVRPRRLGVADCVTVCPGGLDEALNNILTMCHEQNVPFVFALGRRALGRACGKLVPVSVVGIFNYHSCEVSGTSAVDWCSLVIIFPYA